MLLIIVVALILVAQALTLSYAMRVRNEAAANRLRADRQYKQCHDRINELQRRLEQVKKVL